MAVRRPPGDNPAAGLYQPRQRVSAWAGGEVTLWTAGEDTAVGMALAAAAGEPPLCDNPSEPVHRPP